MTQELTVAGVTLPQKYDDKAFDAMIHSDLFIRVQLYGSNSEEVKEGQVPMGTFGLVRGQEITSMGNTFDCLIVGWRPKALCLSGDSFILSYDVESELFKKIVLDSNSMDKNVSRGNMYGPEYLLWLPDHNVFSPYHLSNKSSRYVASQFHKRLGQSATITATLIKNKDFSWHAPTCCDCSVPVQPPIPEEMHEAYNKFVNPNSSELELADQAVEREF